MHLFFYLVVLLRKVLVAHCNSMLTECYPHSGTLSSLRALTLGLASISIWSRSGCQEYMAITCDHSDQVQAWSRSFPLLSSCLSHLLCKLRQLAFVNCDYCYTVLHATRGECVPLQHQRPVVRGDQGVPRRRVQQWVGVSYSYYQTDCSHISIFLVCSSSHICVHMVFV